MSKVHSVFLFALCCMLAVPVHSSRPSSSRLLESAPFDLPVSPAGDRDARDETSIAVSPRDERIVVGASKVLVGSGSASSGVTHVAYYYSSDGGLTWGNATLGLETPQKTWGRMTDPSVVADTDGSFYLCLLAIDSMSFDRGIYTYKSSDGGRTFAEITPVFLDLANSNPRLLDKCYITVDTSSSSPFKNSVYATWQEGGPGLIRVARRRPGEASFSEPKTISHPGDMRGSSITTGPNGELYMAWEGIGNPRVILFNASTDGGDTFLPLVVAPSTDFKIHNFSGSLSQPGPSLLLNGVSRMNSNPVIDVDRSTGPNRGTIYVVWAESPNRTDSDIFIKRIVPPNGDAPAFSAAVKVNSGTGSDQFFPWVSVDSSSGAVEVAFYDRHDDPNGLMTNVYLARSTDGGVTFAQNARMSSASSDPRVQANILGPNGEIIGIGDYIGLTAARGKAHALWTDTRNGKQEIFYGQLAFDSSSGPPPPGSGTCENPRAIASVPYQDQVDSRSAGSSVGLTCSGSPDGNAVWYAITPSVDTVYGVDTVGSDYDTVAGVFTGTCSGGLTLASCSDDFGNAINPANRSILTFTAKAGVTYLIEASGKGGGGLLQFRLGYPTVTSVQYTTAPDETDALRINGAGFVIDDVAVIVQKDGEDTALPKTFFERQGDGTTSTFFATKKKLKKLIKRGNTVIVRVESPAGSGRMSVPFSFTR